MPACSDDVDGISGEVDCVARHLDTRRRLQRCVGNDVLAGGNASQHSAGVVALESRRRELVTMLTALLRDRMSAGADLDGLDGVDAHQCMSDVGVEAVEHGLTE